MALALMFEDDSVLYLDAVINYNKERSNNITSHPVDASGVVSDHVSKSNPRFVIKGVISSADFHNPFTRPYEFSDTVDREYNTPVEEAHVESLPSLMDFLPGILGQVVGSSNTDIVTLDEFRGYSHQVARERLEQAWEKAEGITLLDYDFDIRTGRYISTRQYENCYILNYSDKEEVGTGDSLAFDLTLNQVKKAYIKESDIEITNTASASASGDGDGGEANGEIGDETSEETDMGDNPVNENKRHIEVMGDTFREIGFDASSGIVDNIKALWGD